jgi:hypothetical protein
MIPETRVDKFINKLAELTIDNHIPWQVRIDKSGLTQNFYCEVLDAKIEIVDLPRQKCIKVTLADEENDYYYSPFLDNLIRTVKEFVHTTWALNQFMDDILEGALENDSKGMDGTS